MVVSACTPRTHEPLFQKTLEGSGLNPYLFEFANIREQCSWVHQKEPEKATQKAKDLVRSAVAKVVLAEPLYKKSLEVNKDALIIGGGLAGMTAALDLAEQGYAVYLLEKEEELGGNLQHIKTSLAGEPVLAMLEHLKKKFAENNKITVYFKAQIKEISGYVGNFKTLLESQQEIEHGVVIVATGAEEYTPSEYCFGQDSRIITQRKLEEMLHLKGKLSASLKRVVMIQCVGSRERERNYCSRVCCSQAIKNALTLKELNPDISVYVLYRDIRTYGLKEKYYRMARDKNIVFIRYDQDEKPVVTNNDGELSVGIKDTIINRQVNLHPDLLVLSTGMVPNPENKVLSQFLKVPLNEEGFFLEAHVKLKPVDFATDGVFVCGLAHNPKDISETIAQARAAAGRAATILSKDTIVAEGKVSYVREDRCSGCGACVKVCAYHAIDIDPQKQVSVVNEALCKGCGACSATCRSGAIDLRGFKNEQILAALENL